MQKQNSINIDQWRSLNSTLFQGYINTYYRLSLDSSLTPPKILMEEFEKLNIRGKLDESGYNSAYTIAREIGIFYQQDNGDYILSNMAQHYLQNSLTYYDYMKYYCLNIEFLIKNEVIHPFNEILDVLQEKSLFKEEIAEKTPKLFDKITNATLGCLEKFLNRCVEANLLSKENKLYSLNYNYLVLKDSLNKSNYSPQEFEEKFIGNAKEKQKNIVKLLLEREIPNLFEKSFILNKKGIYDTPQNTHANIIDLKAPIQKIFFGAPGTGKSHEIKEMLQGIDEEQIERVLFYPEYDYHSFIGSYKPITKDDNICYEFVPQVFTNIYVKALKNKDKDYYLVIEEINRGHCAEIFGDIFQLLDRHYSITPSKELQEYLKSQNLGTNHKLSLPNNLHILATMNTSDQSLFPMDSAFKRRFDFEYIPICYEECNEKGLKNMSFDFVVRLNDTEYFKWIEFIKKVNTRIKANTNLGMDKCLGNYFIKPKDKKIELEDFIHKVIFYLYNDVFKDEPEEDSIFKDNTSYEDFFPMASNALEKLKDILKELEVEIRTFDSDNENTH
ncbi:McrB family protein [Helicobacter cetorum]|uniref:McrB family protein n=1 Tax=Helicobacter cetorum TaxID=138563 RepID=UPI000CF07276|nr:AAA family ATPase [Helicobacter cetorum]